MKKTICTFFLLFFITSILFAQKQDYVWLFGYSLSDIISDNARADTTWGGTNFDFNYDPPRIHYDTSRVWDFNTTNTSYCDSTGQMLLYSNGQAIYNGNNGYIEDTINYSPHWLNWSDYVWSDDFKRDTFVNFGLPTIQGALILPMPSVDNQYYILYDEYDLDISRHKDLKYSTIDMNANNGEGEVTLRDEIISRDTFRFGGFMNAIKHANGRDWWFVTLGEHSNLIYTWLIDDKGIHDYGIQDFGLGAFPEPAQLNTGSGQLYFSPDGTKMAVHNGFLLTETGGNINIYDFDRCTGILNNQLFDTIPGFTLAPGLSFSPNGQYLYASNSFFLYQYDLKAEDIIGSRIAIAEYDGYEYYYGPDSTFGRAVSLGFLSLAPDGKIYISSGSNNNKLMGIIDNPNQEGVDCNVKQHSVVLNTTYARGMPNFPNYRLGPLDDSSCDTLGLDNHPIAKYRYDQDTLDELHVYFHDLSYFDPVDYFWEFGDGETSDELESDHNYESTGVYEVCLTVSNEYDTDKFCKSLLLGPDAVKDEEHIVDISLFPNPVIDDMNLSFHNYLPLDARLILYDISGHEVSSLKLHGGMNSLSLRGVKSGIYFYQVVDYGRTQDYKSRPAVLGSGEIVKI